MYHVTKSDIKAPMFSIKLHRHLNMPFRIKGDLMKKIIITCLSIICIAIIIIIYQVRKPKNQLNLIIWSSYMPQSLLDDYEKKTGTHVNMTTFSSPDEMIAKVRAVSPGTYDLVVAPRNDVEILKKVGLLDKLDKNEIPNSKNYAKDWLGFPYDKNNDYSLPYLGSYLALAYNQKKVSPISNYSDLLKSKFKNSAVVVSDARAVIDSSLINSGLDVNQLNTKNLETATHFLTALRPNIKALDSDSPHTLLANGEASVGLIYNAEITMAKSTNKNIVGVYPNSGIDLQVDNFMKFKNAKGGKNVEKFINYVENAKVFSSVVKEYPYLNPNEAAWSYLPKTWKTDPMRNLTSQQLKKAQMPLDIGIKTRVLDKMWNNFVNQ